MATSGRKSSKSIMTYFKAITEPIFSSQLTYLSVSISWQVRAAITDDLTVLQFQSYCRCWEFVSSPLPLCLTIVQSNSLLSL